MNIIISLHSRHVFEIMPHLSENKKKLKETTFSVMYYTLS